MSRTNSHKPRHIQARSGVAWAARMRPVSVMKHRNEPRGGAVNEHAQLMNEYEEDLNDVE